MTQRSGNFSEVPTTWTTGWTDIFNTGTWRSALPVHQHRPAPCHAACPVNGEIPTWIQLIKNGEFEQAWLILTANNPFPAVIGRVCHHPCEHECNRKEYDEKVSVKAMERFLGDMALVKGWQLQADNICRPESIAVVGAGPAGLSAAYQLRKKGFAVTIFEARENPGGLLYYGIPSYRLPRDILTGEIERLIQTGIELKTGIFLEDTTAFRKLRESYSAVFVATGAQHKPGLEGFDDKEEYLDGLDFLQLVNSGTTTVLGNKVVVIGGGNTAVDTSRCALRLGSREVTILYRRDREQMPCSPEEVNEAEEEGVKLELLAAPISIRYAGDRKILFCQRMRLGEPDETGRKRPVPVDEAVFSIEINNIIGATGAQADFRPMEGLLDAKESTSGNSFFAGGDLTSLERYVSSAIGAGARGATAISRYLGYTEETNQENDNPVTFNEINNFYFPSQPTLANTKKPAGIRTEDFREVEQVISSKQAATEAVRCFSCGNCLFCDNCFYFCPDMAVQRDEKLTKSYRVLEQYCKGCGLCVAECPRGAIVLKEEMK